MEVNERNRKLKRLTMSVKGIHLLQVACPGLTQIHIYYFTQFNQLRARQADKTMQRKSVILTGIIYRV